MIGLVLLTLLTSSDAITSFKSEKQRKRNIECKGLEIGAEKPAFAAGLRTADWLISMKDEPAPKKPAIQVALSCHEGEWCGMLAYDSVTNYLENKRIIAVKPNETGCDFNPSRAPDGSPDKDHATRWYGHIPESWSEVWVSPCKAEMECYSAACTEEKMNEVNAEIKRVSVHMYVAMELCSAAVMEDAIKILFVWASWPAKTVQFYMARATGRGADCIGLTHVVHRAVLVDALTREIKLVDSAPQKLHDHPAQRTVWDLEGPEEDDESREDNWKIVAADWFPVDRDISGKYQRQTQYSLKGFLEDALCTMSISYKAVKHFKLDGPMLDLSDVNEFDFDMLVLMNAVINECEWFINPANHGLIRKGCNVRPVDFWISLWEPKNGPQNFLADINPGCEFIR